MEPHYKPNDPNQQPMTDKELLAEFNAARVAFGTAKSASTDALARLYLAYRHMMFPSAPPDNKQWFARQIATHNLEVGQQSPQQVADKKKRALVSITLTGEPNNDLLAFVKLVADLRRAGDETHASRVRRALEWVMGRFDQTAIVSAEDVTEAVKNAGGFEAVIQSARGNPSKGDPNLVAAVAKAVLAEIASRAKEQAPLFATDLPPGSVVANGLHAALVRSANGRLEVVGHHPLDAEKDGALLSAFRVALLPTSGGAPALLSRIHALSGIVPEGGLTMLTEGGGWNTAPLKEERVLLLRSGAGGLPEIVVTARHVDASPVVLIRPTAACGPLALDPGSCLALMKADRQKFEKLFAVDDVERILSVSAPNTVEADHDVGAVGVVWRASIIAETKAKDHKSFDFKWWPIGPHAHRPVEVANINKTITASATAEDIRTLKVSALDPAMAKVRDGKPDAKPTAVRVTSNGVTMRLAAVAGADVSMAVAQPASKPVQLLFRLSDLYATVSVLLRVGVTQAEVAVDEVGLLAFTWSDAVASYSVFLPAMSTTGGLLTNHFRQIDVGTPAVTAQAAPAP